MLTNVHRQLLMLPDNASNTRFKSRTKQKKDEGFRGIKYSNLRADLHHSKKKTVKNTNTFDFVKNTFIITAAF